jgi:hypothetical protein
VPEPLALATQLILSTGLEPRRVVDERPQLRKPRLCSSGAGLHLVVATPGSGQFPPGGSEFGTPALLLVPEEGIENVQLVGRPREPALLELAGHGDEPLAGGGEIFSRSGAAPGIRARAPVREDTSRHNELLLVFGTELGERDELVLVEQSGGKVKLGLHIGLGPLGADVGGVSLGAEEQADRLGENRLARAGLARDGIEPGREGQLGLVNEDEVLDPEATEHLPPRW